MNLLLLKITVTMKWNMLWACNTYQLVCWIKIFNLAPSLNKLSVVWVIYRQRSLFLSIKWTVEDIKGQIFNGSTSQNTLHGRQVLCTKFHTFCTKCRICSFLLAKPLYYHLFQRTAKLQPIWVKSHRTECSQWLWPTVASLFITYSWLQSRYQLFLLPVTLISWMCLVLLPSYFVWCTLKNKIDKTSYQFKYETKQ